MLFRNIKMTYNWTPCVSVSIGPDCQGCQPQKAESLPISCRSFPAPGDAWQQMARGGRAQPAHLMCAAGGGCAVGRQGWLLAQSRGKESENLASLSLALFSALLLHRNRMEMPPTCISSRGCQGTFLSHSPRASLRSRWSEFAPCCAQGLLAVQTAASAGTRTLTGVAATSWTSLSIAFSPASKHAAGCPRRGGCFFNYRYAWPVAGLPPDSECFHEQQLHVWTSEHTVLKSTSSSCHIRSLTQIPVTGIAKTSRKHLKTFSLI